MIFWEELETIHHKHHITMYGDIVDMSSVVLTTTKTSDLVILVTCIISDSWEFGRQQHPPADPWQTTTIENLEFSGYFTCVLQTVLFAENQINRCG